jgi:DNA polymerase III delta prime subunit
MNYKTNNIPWVEKYRPIYFSDIVLDPLNKIIMETIIRTKYFPNLLFYGPPGTGKTTTIINLIDSFQGEKKKGLTIHLNASDDRGIDIIRNQISQFMNSDSLFSNGMKFVILDEVDYMTKNAQHALKYLMQGYNNTNVRFCLICNYISRIDESLQNEFTRIKFNQLPEVDIIKFLSIICDKENIDISNEKLSYIQHLFNSDIRSMINYIQSNYKLITNKNIINNNVWNNLTDYLKSNHKQKDYIQYIEKISSDYNIEIKNLIKDYLNYIIRYRQEYLTDKLINFSEFIIHIHNPNIDYIKNYTTIVLHEIFNDIL